MLGEKSSLALAVERARAFPGVGKIALLTGPEGLPGGAAFEGVLLESRSEPWTVKALLEAIAALASRGAEPNGSPAPGEGAAPSGPAPAEASSAPSGAAPFDFCYFAWADCPFLDPELAGKLAERHMRYVAEYSYADGWPYGLAPELLSPGTAALLAKILGADDGGPVRRDALFSVIQKDINAFDIEAEISSIDLRPHRLSLCADSKRSLLLLRRFASGGESAGGANGIAGGAIPDTAAVERIVTERPELLRALPAFYPIQVFGGCPQACAFCPWPQAALAAGGKAVTERRDFMEARRFEALLEKIIAFSGDAVVDLSLWGEIALHPQKIELIETALSRPELALVIETSGIGWKAEELEQIAALAQKAPPRRAAFPAALSWIVSLDSADPARYKELRGAGFAEASDCAKRLLALFPKDAYVQAVRAAGAEDDIERFYRTWQEAAGGTASIIIQKYDDFCGMLPRRQASDLSPVQRQPCWHLMRDMPILIDGSVPLCRQQISRQQNSAAGSSAANSGAANSGAAILLGNAFDEALEAIWERGRRHYEDHASASAGEKAQAKAGGAEYDSLCAGCDEYYTYNF